MSSRITDPFAEQIAAERRTSRRYADAFVRACGAGDAEAVLDIAAVLAVEAVDGWRLALKKMSRAPRPSRDVQMALLRAWVESKSIRMHAGDDIVVLNALRVMLPPYEGPPVTLYRGDNALRARRDRCGMAWTRDIETARRFAQHERNLARLGGGVVLEALAPAAAIVSASHLSGDHYDEDEFIVDRRLLRSIRTIERFAEVPMPGHAITA
jgi:hypothetical protein